RLPLRAARGARGGGPGGRARDRPSRPRLESHVPEGALRRAQPEAGGAPARPRARGRRGLSCTRADRGARAGALGGGEVRTANGRRVACGIGLLAATACTPKVVVEPPKEPITINMNIKIEHDIHVRVDKDLDAAISSQKDIF